MLSVDLVILDFDGVLTDNRVYVCRDKATAVAQLIADRGLDPNRIVYVGNDTNDLQAMELVGHRVAPADAHMAVRSIATLVTVARGGEGVVRELADVILGDESTNK